MAEMSTSTLDLSRRVLLQALATLVASPASAIPTSTTALCLEWLRADARLDGLTLEWSQAEAQVVLGRMQGGPLVSADQMRNLDREIRKLDRLRSALLGRIVSSVARDSLEALAKLVICQRLLEGEGGPEHDLVADAVRFMTGPGAGGLPSFG